MTRIAHMLPAVLGVVCIAAVARGQGTSLVAPGSSWRYLDDGSNQGTTWRNPGFVDSGWAGPAPAKLGYGDGDEATVVDYGPEATNKYRTTYFRKTVNLPAGSLIQWLEMELLRDDGAVVYVNGNEIWRENMPGVSDWQTFASSTVGGADEARFWHRSAPVGGLMVDGDNVFAVEVHQRTADSSDLGFDFSCTGFTNDLLITRGATWRYLDTGVDAGTAWVNPSFNDAGWLAGGAELGYGDGDEITVVDFGGNALNKHVTTYFRRAFTVAEPDDVEYLRLRLRRDDGAVVYLNGTEVWRADMPAGPVTWQTRAATTIGGANEANYLVRVVNGNVLQAGTNVCAVEIHQAAVTSSDISFDFACEAFTNEIPPSVVRGPYLQRGSPTGMVVCWRTDVATDSWVCFGDAPGNLATAVMVPGATTDHAVHLSGLVPGTTYTYAIGDTDYIFEGDDTDHQFTTHPLPGSIRPVRVWVLGDSGEANTAAENVRDAYYAWSGSAEPDLWLLLGDNAYNDGTDTEYQDAVFAMYPETLRESVAWPTLGNHDGHSAFSVTETGPYYDIFHLPENGEAGGEPSLTEAWYAFDYANIHFICLNSYDVDRTTSGAMYAWLQADLAQVTADWIIAFWHHPPYSKGSHNSDSEGRLVDMRVVFLPVLEAAGVDLVLGGHSHAYERSKFVHGHYGLSGTLSGSMVIDGGSGRGDATGPVYDKTATNAAVYAVAGSSSKISGGSLNHPVMYLSLNELGSLVLDIHSNRLDATFLGDSPVVLDTFSVVKAVDAYDLTTAAQGPGAVVPSGGTFSAGTEVRLAAEPDTYYGFSNWTDDLAGTNNPDAVTLDADKLVTAVFEAITVTNNVPVWWLALHGLDLTDAAALQDADGDGALTWEEWVADTLPTIGASRLQVSDMQGGSPVSVQFEPTSAARVYDVEFREDTGPWQAVTGGVAGTGGPLSINDDPLSGDRSYRIRVRVP